MAFFNQISKKASEIANKTVQKTQEFAETSKLNSMISDEEKRINSYCFQIGKLYLSKHRNDYEPEFADIIPKILESESKIANYKKTIKKLQKYRSCPNCGADVPPDASFCNSCGHPMPKETDNFVTCKKCGAQIEDSEPSIFNFESGNNTDSF